MYYGLYTFTYITSDFSGLTKIINMLKRRIHFYSFFILEKKNTFQRQLKQDNWG